MKTFTVAACTAFIVGLGCGTAQAHPPIVKATPAGQPPPVSWQQDALAAAESYWHHAAPWDPTCQMTVSYASLGDPTEGGETDNNCNIVINDREGWIYPDVLCLTLTHELGHVVLGPNAFPDNPSDPAHSSDPTNIMYPVIFDVTTPQCTAMLNTIYPPLHRHRHPSALWSRWSRWSQLTSRNGVVRRVLSNNLLDSKHEGTHGRSVQCCRT